MKTLRDRVAVVTGAASGIGRALAERFAADGAMLAISDVAEGPLEETRQALERQGASVLAVHTDVRDPEAVDALARATLERFGRIHVVCNNAGVAVAGALWECSLDALRLSVDVNLWGVIHGIRTFVPILLEQGEEGHLVNIASMAAVTTTPYLDVYTATKHGVMALSECLHKELQAQETAVRTSVVCPGLIDTGLMQQDVGDDARSDGADAMRALLTQGTTDGYPPSVVADAVAEAIHEERFYVFPAQPELMLGLDRRLEDLATKRNPGSPPGA